jgi:Ca2+-binding RTX toxin-like protein
VVNSAADQIYEYVDEGVDTVRASSSYTLSDNIENLILTGAGNTQGTGNGLDNTLTGNTGKNVLTGGAGIDTLAGGAGDDTYVLDAAGDIVTELAGEGSDLVKADFSYSLVDTDGAGTRGGNVEKLTLTGSADIDGTGNGMDNVITGNSGANKLTGGAGHDSLVGAAGSDTLLGGAGNDTLQGGAGKDALTGGADADVFDFNALAELGATSATRDVITDFTGGLDRVDLSGVDADSVTAGDQAFTYIGTDSFASRGDATGLVRFTYDAANNLGILYGSTDADTTAEFMIQFNGVSSMSAADFLL